MPRSPAMPQQGTPLGTTSLAHIPASCSRVLLMPAFLLLQGTCTATQSRTFLKSSLSTRNTLMNSAGSYSENLRQHGLAHHTAAAVMDAADIHPGERPTAELQSCMQATRGCLPQCIAAQR